ncbi:transcriptional regulator, DeoR family [Micrococcales bacterium KH10]|nr:transcriptional regulator, DeoR family [Micrococcales bacterium KH10]
MNAMYALERHHKIIELARADGRVDVAASAALFDVSGETIRRDLTTLERRGLLRRVHGGAIPVDRIAIEPTLADRERSYLAEKERIANAAILELDDAATVLIDAGTTTARFAALLPHDRELTVVTHALPVASALAGRPNLALHLIGGIVRGRTLAAVGPWANRELEDLQADIAFLGTNGVSTERGLTTPDVTEAAVKEAIVAAARRVVVIADHSKVGRDEFVSFAPIDAVDTLITDSDVDDELATEIETAGVQVIRA